MSYIHNGRLFTDDGSLNTLFWGSVVSRPLKAGGFASDASGNVYIEHSSPGTLTRHDGICTTGDGALFVTTDVPGAGNYRNNGIRFRADGAMHVTSGGPAAGDTMHNGWRISALGQAYVTSSFQAKFADLGAGAVDTTTIFSVGSGTPTFTRATAAATKLSTGLWKLDVASGTARSSYIGLNTAVGAYGGYLAEGAATQLCLDPRDMTTANWVLGATMTRAKTSIGIDGTATSATRLTGGAVTGTNTILQTLIAASTSRTYSAWVRRVTGTGTITLLQGTATLDITALINSVTYTLVQLNDNELNVAFGLQIATNGDAIDVDCNQFEAGAFATTPIPAAGTRNADVMTFPAAGNYAAAAGAMYAEFSPYVTNIGLTQGLISIDNGAAERQNIRLSTVGAFQATQVGTNVTGLVPTTNVISKGASSWNGTVANGLTVALNGTLTAGSAAAIPAGATVMRIGSNEGNLNMLLGAMKNVRLWQRPLPDGILAQLTT